MREFRGLWNLHASEIRRVGWLVILLAVAALGTRGDEPQRSETVRGGTEPLQGSIHLRIDDPAHPHRRGLRLDQPGAVPLKARDQFRIEARLNRKAYLYIFWLGSDGKVGPIYPWAPGHWERRPAEEAKTDRLDLPPKTGEAWEIPSGDPGLEAVVLLAREDSPLPREMDLAKLLSGLLAQSGPTLDKAVWIENGREVILDPQNRTAPSLKTRKTNDPVLRMRRLLQEKVLPLGDYSQAVLFRNQGG
jgi:hypothetical protein